MTQDKIVARIRALLAKAAGTTNEHEAAAFAAKAQELLAAHNLSESEVAARAAGTERVVEHRVDDPYLDPWRIRVYADVAELYFCGSFRHWFTRVNKKGSLKAQRGMTFVGREHNVAVAASMAEYLISTVVRLSRAYSPDRAQQLAFQRGCGLRVGARLRALTAEARAPKQEPTATGTALVVLYSQELQAAQDHMATLGLKPGKSMKVKTDGESFAAGQRAGSSISLNTQVGGAAAQQRISA